MDEPAGRESAELCCFVLDCAWSHRSNRRTLFLNQSPEKTGPAVFSETGKPETALPIFFLQERTCPTGRTVKKTFATIFAIAPRDRVVPSATPKTEAFTGAESAQGIKSIRIRL